MPKASVDITQVASRGEVEGLLKEWGVEGLESYAKCYGGFSGSNYACVLTDGRKLLLKCTNDQPIEDVDAQVRALLFMRSGDTAPPTCYPWPLADTEKGYVSMTTGSPSIILDFLEGGPADKVLLKAGPSITARLFGGAVRRPTFPRCCLRRQGLPYTCRAAAVVRLAGRRAGEAPQCAARKARRDGRDRHPRRRRPRPLPRRGPRRLLLRRQPAVARNLLRVRGVHRWPSLPPAPRGAGAEPGRDDASGRPAGPAARRPVPRQPALHR